jgi:hypothetical protein
MSIVLRRQAMGTPSNWERPVKGKAIPLNGNAIPNYLALGTRYQVPSAWSWTRTPGEDKCTTHYNFAVVICEICGACKK